jgi:hypothetical protein
MDGWGLAAWMWRADHCGLRILDCGFPVMQAANPQSAIDNPKSGGRGRPPGIEKPSPWTGDEGSMTTRGATPIRPAQAGLTRCRDRTTAHWQDARRNLAQRISDPLSLDNGGVSGAVY